MELWWSEEDADYIRHRSSRYFGSLDIEPAWTEKATADEHLVELSPYPASRVLIAYRDLDGEFHGMNAWPASGRDLATYRKAVSDDEEP